jgi:hypothetical protein
MDPYLPTLQEVQRTQMMRLDIVHILADPRIEEIITGCFVRVLLEIESGREDYRIFTIKSVSRGNPYTGFSSDSQASTDLYIELNLPTDLRGINGIAFQLNSVSNSRITAQEYNAWSASPGPQPGDTEAAVAARIQVLQNHPILGVQRNRAGNTPAPRGSALAENPSINNSTSGAFTCTVMPHRSGPTISNPVRSAPPQPAPASTIPDVLNAETALRVVMEELRESFAIFADPCFEDHKTALLRTAERDIADYLDKVREAIQSQRHTCVVCMDRPPTVVTLPCKHQVLCRLCASQVNNCPCCRETAVEVFEPIEP